MKLLPFRPAKNAGMSFVEIITVVSAIAIVVSVAASVTTNVTSRVAEQKLVSEVESINRAIRIYEASGGDLTTTYQHPWWVLGALKNQVAEADKDESTGLTGALIDKRLQPVFMKISELATDMPRAQWNTSTRQFEVSRSNTESGLPIKGFKVTDDDWIDKLVTKVFANGTNSHRDKRAYDYAKEGNWVWDYEDRIASGGNSPTEVVLNLPGAPTPAGVPAGKTQLQPPLFSPDGGSFDLSDFNLSVTLVDPNVAGLANIYYTMSHGSWEYYDGTPISVPWGTKITAFAEALDTDDYVSSGFVKATYTSTLVTPEINLATPAAITYEEAGGAMIGGGTPGAPGVITLLNGDEIPDQFESSNYFDVFWSFDGSDPRTSGAGVRFQGNPFSLSFAAQDVPLSLPLFGAGSTVTVNAGTEAYDSHVFRPSALESATVGIQKMTLRAPQIREGGGTITMQMVTMFGDMPQGARIFYTKDGTDPGNNNGQPVSGTLYTGPFAVATGTGCRSETISARVYGPSPYAHWFNASGASSMAVSKAPSPGSPASIASGFENSALADYGVLALGDGRIQAQDNAQIWGGIGVGPGNEPDLDGVSVSANFEVDPTAIAGKRIVNTLPGGTPAPPVSVDLSQAAADAIALSFTAAALTPTQTFAKIDATRTITAGAADGFNVIQTGEINLGSGKSLTLSGGADDWFILNVTNKVTLGGAGILLTGGLPVSHVLINMASTNEFKASNTASVAGTLLAPRSKVTGEHQSTFNGVVIAGKDSVFKNDVVVQTVGNSFACTGGGDVMGDGTGTQLDMGFTAPTALTYFEVGGAAMPGGPAIAVQKGLVSLENADDIDDGYESSGVFQVYWTYDGSDPTNPSNSNRVKGGSFAGGYPEHEVSLALALWTGNTLPVQVVGLSLQTDIVTDSAITGAVLQIEKTKLATPTVSYVDATRMVTLGLVTSGGDMPPGARIFYNTDGTFPEVDGSGEPVNAFEYTGPFDLATQKSNGCGDYNIIARVYAPVGLAKWFTPSDSATLAREITPVAGTVGAFAYEFNTSALSGYTLVALGTQFEGKNLATVIGNIAFGPAVKRKIAALSISGSYDADPTTTIDGDNVSLVSDGSPVSANSTDLSQAKTDAIALSAKAASFASTQVFGNITVPTTITSTAVNGYNVITIDGIDLNKENLTLSGGPNDWFILNVKNNAKFVDSALIVNGGIPSNHVILNSWNTSDVIIDGDRTIQATIFAPRSKVEIKDDAVIEGMLVTGKNSKMEHESAVVGEDLAFGGECGDGGGATDDGPTLLAEPVFSVAGGTHPTNAFPLTLALNNPNEALSSTIQYRVNGGGWSTYSAAITVAANDTVEAFADSIDDGRWTDSAVASHTYTPGVPELAAPVISTTAPKFDAATAPTVTVSISDPNTPGTGTLEYSLDGGGWSAYAGSFVLTGTNYTSKDALIKARVRATDPLSHSNSPEATKYVYRMVPAKLLKPVITITPTGTGSVVTIEDSNPPGTSNPLFLLVPLPSALGCDIVHGGPIPPGTFISYGGPVAISDATYPSGFGVMAYSQAVAAGFIDSDITVAYDESDNIGLRGGHFDVDTSGRTKYAAIYPSFPGGGSTDKHTHEYDNKYDTAVIDLFNMGVGHANIFNNVAAGERFKIIIVNANLSPAAHMAVNQSPSYSAPYVTTYDNTAFASLPIYSLDGIAGTTQLTALSIVFDEDAIVNAGLLPSNTGSVKGNTPGKAGEWRNGALTLQVVKVDAAGNLPGGPLNAARSNGDHGVGDGQAVIHEVTVFWHWPGASYHESGNPYVPGSQFTIVSELDSAEEPVCDGL